MNYKRLFFGLILTLTLSLGGIAFNVHAQEDVKEGMKKDKTGTNPVNFQRESRLYNEHSWLNTEGDGDQNVTTFEFRTPFANGKWQFRMRARYKTLTVDLDDDGANDVDESGFGDMDVRFITVPYFKGTNAIAYGLEAFLDTASEDVLGSGTTSLGPQVFYAKFFRGGFGPYKGGGLFAPGLQYQFSVHEAAGRNNVDQINIDLNFLMMGTSKLFWFFTDPQIVINNETDETFAIVDLEFGWMMAMWFKDLKGHSVYVRPSFGVGDDRPTDGSVEVGYKIVGW
jgi:hypothetical protein